MQRLDAFMAQANAAYYASRDPLREFTTSPEISQIFGEVLGALFVDLYTRIGSPPALHLIEAGPGRGTLMADIWRIVGRAAPAMAAASQIHFIETSALLRAEQQKRVPHAHWHDDLESVPPGPGLVIANEFLDALPIRQFVATTTGWDERFVDHGAFVTRPAENAPGPSSLPPGSVLEVNEAAQRWCALIAARVLRDGGAAIVIDYGYGATAPGETLQALYQGRPADPLADPGSRDLTAHVDFAAMARAAKAARVFGPVTQQALLTRLGLLQRAEMLARANTGQSWPILQAAHRLIAPTGMGGLFKAIAIAHPHIAAIPGFEPQEPAP